MPDDEQKLQMIIDLLQQVNKSLAEAAKLMAFLAGKKIKK